MNLVEVQKKNTSQIFNGIPAHQGYYFPAEWVAHEATWLSWPHNSHTWLGNFKKMWPSYLEFIRILSLSEKVHINIKSHKMAHKAHNMIKAHGAQLDQIIFYQNPTNDAWCRDHGPAFLTHPDPSIPKIIVDWEYNAWGNKYPPYDCDNNIPSQIASQLGLAVSKPGIVMEGGSVDFNGNGVLITSESCLLHPNRNPTYTKTQIEDILKNFYGVTEILWVKSGIVGDDTDGHIDDTVRFVDESSVITMVEKDSSDQNYKPLKLNRNILSEVFVGGRPLSVIEIDMPEPIYFDGQRLPASYANFYISNEHVIVPIFKSKNDDQALSILRDCFPTRRVIGIDSQELIVGLGSFHCLSQQQPL